MAASVAFSHCDGTNSILFKRRDRLFDDGVEVLFRIVMQCQIVDDVYDHDKDVSGGLPGFATVPACRQLAINLTRAGINSVLPRRNIGDVYRHAVLGFTSSDPGGFVCPMANTT